MLPSRSVEGRRRVILERLMAMYAPSPADDAGRRFSDRGLDDLATLASVAEDGDALLDARCAALHRIRALGAEARQAGTPGLEAVADRIKELVVGASTPAPVRAAASKAVVSLGDEQQLEEISKRLASDDPRLVSAAARAMGLAKYQRAVPMLIALLVRHPSSLVQSACATSLGEIGDPRALRALEMAFMSQRALLPVIEAIGKIGGPDQIPLLTLTLRDSSNTVRLAGAEALTSLVQLMPDERRGALATYVRAALQREQDPHVGVVLIACMTRCGAEVDRAHVERILGVDFGAAAVRSALGNALRGRPIRRRPVRHRRH